MREFFAVTDFEMDLAKRSRTAWDMERLSDMEHHLKSLGVEL